MAFQGSDLVQSVRRHLLETVKTESAEVVFTNVELLTFLNNELAATPAAALAHAMPHLIKRATATGSSGVAVLPADMRHLLSVVLNTKPVRLLPATQLGRFYDDSHGTAANPVGVLYASTSADATNKTYGQILYTPTSETALVFVYIPGIAKFSNLASYLEMPEWFASIVVNGAVARALVAMGEGDKAGIFKTLRDEQLGAFGGANA